MLAVKLSQTWIYHCSVPSGIRGSLTLSTGQPMGTVRVEKGAVNGGILSGLFGGTLGPDMSIGGSSGGEPRVASVQHMVQRVKSCDLHLYET